MTRRGPVAHGAIDDVEPDFLALGDDEGGAPQHQPDPQNDADLMGPANRQVQRIPEDDLEEEGGEHRREHGGSHVLGAASEPEAERSCGRNHAKNPCLKIIADAGA